MSGASSSVYFAHLEEIFCTRNEDTASQGISCSFGPLSLAQARLREEGKTCYTAHNPGFSQCPPLIGDKKAAETRKCLLVSGRPWGKEAETASPVTEGEVMGLRCSRENSGLL